MRLVFDLAVSLPVPLAIEMGRDSKHVLRVWAKHPWQTGFAVVALSVALGANIGVFSVVNALLLRSLPFRDPRRVLGSTVETNALRFNHWIVDATLLDIAACTLLEIS